MRTFYFSIGAAIGVIAGIYLATSGTKKDAEIVTNPVPVREVKVVIERENIFEPTPGFGLIYRIETQTSEGRRPYFFVGEEQELRELDRNFNIGDRVIIEERAMIMSLDGEQGLLPDWMRHY